MQPYFGHVQNVQNLWRQADLAPSYSPISVRRRKSGLLPNEPTNGRLPKTSAPNFIEIYSQNSIYEDTREGFVIARFMASYGQNASVPDRFT